MSATITLHPTLACDLSAAFLNGVEHGLDIHIVRGRLVYREKKSVANIQTNVVEANAPLPAGWATTVHQILSEREIT